MGTGRSQYLSRGISSVAAIVIAVVVIILGFSVIRWVLSAAFSLLRFAIELGVLVLLVLIIAFFIRKFWGKVAE